MPLPVEVQLYDYETPDDRCQLSAVLDELTLTYSVVERRPGGHTRKLTRTCAPPGGATAGQSTRQCADMPAVAR